MDISHCLLTNKKYKKEEINEIFSHPQAIGQCRKYIKNNFEHCKINEIESTGKGAILVKNLDKSACIANRICAKIYDLEVLEENIQDKNNNQTRFVVLSKYKSDNINNKKISLMFSTENKPGDLYKILGIFNIFEVNLSKIESRPAQTGLGDYWFWVDIEGNIKDEKMNIVLDIIKKKCSYFRILGTY